LQQAHIERTRRFEEHRLTLQKLSHQNRFTFVIACPVSDGAPRQKPDIVQQRRVFISPATSKGSRPDSETE
jgi:hypothetical protein